MGACNRSRGGVWPLFRYGVKWLCAFAGWHFTFGIGVPRSSVYFAGGSLTCMRGPRHGTACSMNAWMDEHAKKKDGKMKH